MVHILFIVYEDTLFEKVGYYYVKVSEGDDDSHGSWARDKGPWLC
jgi:hypothetical protein